MNPHLPLRDPSCLLSPSLLIDRATVRENLTKLIGIAGGVERLRPHVKTHKMAAIVQLAESLGIRKHKCATIAEADMIGEAGGTDALLAYPLVGPNVARFVALIQRYPATVFRALVDCPVAARELSEAAAALPRPIPVLVDLDVGMGRTGIDPGDPAFELYQLLAELPNLSPDGLHAYDGHVHDTDLEDRRRSVLPGQEQTLALRARLLARGLPVPRLVMGGTPSFPIHARLPVPEVECSPGTIVLQDQGYLTAYPDLPFAPAAFLLTRVVSRPRPGRLCFDLGHKAVAADPAGPRVRLIGLDDARFVGHNEEHLVVETAEADRFPVGTCLLAIPTHICPTTALHRTVSVVEQGELVGEWPVTARDRVLHV
jgi:D-serine deaminase-like pyridoxal phosphate-dependent protein